MRELKKEAKAILRERFGFILLGFFLAYIVPIVLTVLMSVSLTIGSVSNGISIVIAEIALVILMLVINSIFMLGKNFFALNLVKKNEEASLTNLLFGFKKFYKPILLTILIDLMIFAVVLVIAIPYTILFGVHDIGLMIIEVAIISFISIFISVLFSQSYYILAEDNTKGVIQCLSESKKLMKGNKLRYVGLILSFIGWFLLMFIVTVLVIVAVSLINENLSFLGNIISYILMMLIYPYVELALAAFHLKISKEKYGDQSEDVNGFANIVSPE